MDTHQGLDMKKRAGQANGHRGVPSSRELRPVPGGRRRRRPRGELGGGGGSARAVARGKLRRGAAGLAPPPSRAPSASTRGEAAGAGRWGGEGGRGGAAGPRSFPRGLLSPASPEPPSPGGAPSPARSDSLLTKAKRGAAGGGAARAAGWYRGRAGGREPRRREAPRSGWSWEDAAAAAATSPKTQGETQTLPARGGIRLQ
uniref:Uncharacterized protein n=1 Tax=Aquila chrysaetos chrysaetos TaxID=223781 RepID=A0A663E4J5_AQUCH